MKSNVLFGSFSKNGCVSKMTEVSKMMKVSIVELRLIMERREKGKKVMMSMSKKLNYQMINKLFIYCQVR